MDSESIGNKNRFPCGTNDWDETFHYLRVLTFREKQQCRFPSQLSSHPFQHSLQQISGKPMPTFRAGCRSWWSTGLYEPLPLSVDWRAGLFVEIQIIIIGDWGGVFTEIETRKQYSQMQMEMGWCRWNLVRKVREKVTWLDERILLICLGNCIRF